MSLHSVQDNVTEETSLTHDLKYFIRKKRDEIRCLEAVLLKVELDKKLSDADKASVWNFTSYYTSSKLNRYERTGEKSKK
jgi:hypothetical protein